MDPISSEYIASILVELTSRLAAAGGRRLHRELHGNDAAQALRAPLEAGLVAMLAEARNTTEAESDLLEAIFRTFLTDEETAPALKPLLRGNPVDHEELALIFEDLGYDASTLPGLGF